MAAKKSPFDRVIAAFGDEDSVAKAVGVPRKRVYAWGAPATQKGSDGRIPVKWQGPILSAARKLGLSLTAEDLIDMRTPHVRAAEDVQ